MTNRKRLLVGGVLALGITGGLAQGAQAIIVDKTVADKQVLVYTYSYPGSSVAVVGVVTPSTGKVVAAAGGGCSGNGTTSGVLAGYNVAGRSGQIGPTGAVPVGCPALP